jgi:transglutaminase-like putative cysteine protease
MQLRITHTTTYAYADQVSLSPHILYLYPRASALVHVRQHTLVTTPAAHLQVTRDPLDNDSAYAYFDAPLREITFAMHAELETRVSNPFDFVLKHYARRYPFSYEPVFDFALGPYLAPPYHDTQDALRRWLDRHLPERSADTVTFLTALNTALFETLRYERRDHMGIQPSRLTLDRGAGACRDYAVLFIELCRTLGIAARFVSGYLWAPPDDDRRSAGAMHAWAEVYLPGAGWRGLDPTHGIWCHDAFVPVAHAAQAESVNPIQGIYYAPVPVPSRLTAHVAVDRID